MKLISFVLTFILMQTTVLAQKPTEWIRVYTYDDSVIEINATDAIVFNEKFGRVTVRWTFDSPQKLRQGSSITSKSRLDLMEFDCANKLVRTLGVAVTDSNGRLISVQGIKKDWDWAPVDSPLTGTIFDQACRLIASKVPPPPDPNVDPNEKEAAEFAQSFVRRLNRTRDVGPLIDQFFAPRYLDRYLQDTSTNWFAPLDRGVAERVSRNELRRYYVARLNAAFLASAYYGMKLKLAHDEPISESEFIPKDVKLAIERHPYTARYKDAPGDYNYLSEPLDSVARMRSYIDMLDKVNILMRRHLTEPSAYWSLSYWQLMDKWVTARPFFTPKASVCRKDCLGLPKDTRLYELDLPVFSLQVAEINGAMRIVSVKDAY